jgi:murein DD-endopeptidase MepM/ murein hydrolase activator NlpD
MILSVGAVVLAGYWLIFQRPGSVRRTGRVMTFLRGAAAHPEWVIQGGQRCGSAPFILPTSGLIGFLWDDSFRPGHRHQGIDIFGGGPVNDTLVVAAYPGYLTRQPDWKSSLIIRIPDDPLHPGRQIWTYYTHMADEQGESFISEQFPPGATEVYVEAGTPLGYQGNYSGDPGNPVGVHLHFSIAKDDGAGKYLNELKIENTLDPSPYLGINLNARQNHGEILLCP